MYEIQKEAYNLYHSLNYLCYALCAIFGLIGALRIYSLWNIHGKHHIHIDAQVIAWVSAAVFFVCAAFFIKAVLL